MRKAYAAVSRVAVAANSFKGVGVGSKKKADDSQPFLKNKIIRILQRIPHGGSWRGRQWYYYHPPVWFHHSRMISGG